MMHWEGAPWEPREWQRAALPVIIDHLRGRKRAVISAIMGAGKSVLIAELAYTAVAKLKPDQRIIVTTPTQALVKQLAATISARCPDVGVFYGVKKQPGAQVIVTCNPSLGALAAVLATEGARCGVWIADEVHKTEAGTLIGATKMLSPAAAVGFTATPYRSDGGERLSLWDVVAYRYTLDDALRDGVLVPWDVVNWDGEGKDQSVDDVCLTMIREQGQGPGVVSAATIADAEAYASYLTEHDVEARAIHSKLPARVKAERMESLRTGEIRCLVHVSMLSEGVDMPWLRWLCLRRKVEAVVRFVQEIGRVLRCHPNKERAVIMDPFALFLRHGIAHPEALADAMEPKPCPKYMPDPSPDGDAERDTAGNPMCVRCGFDIKAHDKEPRDDEDAEAQERKPLRPVAVGAVEAWVGRLLTSLQAAGIGGKVERREYNRNERPSDRQVAALGRMAFSIRYMPACVRPGMRAIVKSAGRLRYGVVSDAMNVMGATLDASKMARERKRHWAWPEGLDVEAMNDGLLESLGGKQ